MDTALPGKKCSGPGRRITLLYLHENFIRIAFQINNVCKIEGEAT